MLDSSVVEQAARYAGEGPILVGLSGGGDSVALLQLLLREFRPKHLRVGVIDHAVRVGSDVEAAEAARAARSLDVEVRVRRLNWPEDARFSQARARHARHAALYEIARETGARVIALGHTADDQIETFLMRAARDAPWRALAGIAPFAPAPIWPEGRGLFVARPLLRARRHDLRQWLTSRQAAWIEDPSNENLAFERVRARRRLAMLEREGWSAARVLEICAELRVRAQALDAATTAWLAPRLAWQGGAVLLAGADWDVVGDEVRERALSALLAAVSGAAHEAGAEGLSDRLSAPAFAGLTVGGCRVRPERGQFRFGRDPGAVHGRGDLAAPAALELAPGETAIWDGRCLVEAGSEAVGVSASPHDPDQPAFLGPGKVVKWLGGERLSHLLFTAP